MKSNVCMIKKGGNWLQAVLAEVEKVTEYNRLPHKEALRLRLLAEELTGMLPELLENFEGLFWLQNIKNEYELHVELSVREMSKEKKASILDVSRSGKNAAARGFMGKIREVTENLLLSSDEGFSYPAYQYTYHEMGDVYTDVCYTHAWTLEAYSSQYREAAIKQSGEEWDQLEKSIVAKLADDVIVGVRGKKVDIIIKKEFKEIEE